jgi:O-antigen/teichoic acid export membrane protein
MEGAIPGSGRARRAAFDVGIYGIAQVTSAGLALLLLALLGRTLGRAGFGEFSYAFVIALLGSLLADFGTGPWLTRATAQDPAAAPARLSDALALRAKTTLLAWVLTLGLAWWHVRDAGRLLEVALLLVYMTLNGYVALFESLLMGRGRTGWVSLSTGGGKLLELLGVGLYLLMARSASTVAGVAMAFAAASACRLIVLVSVTRLVHGREKREARTDTAPVLPGLAQPVWRQALPFAAGALLWTTYNRVDVLILERFVTRSDLGLYTASYRVLEALLLVPRSLVGVLYPIVARAWAEGALYGEILARPARLLFLVSVGAAGGLAALAPDVMRFLFGEPFRAGAPALFVLALALVPLFLNQLLGAVLGAVHRQGRWLAATCGALVVNVTANFVLIPRLGFAGAAWATLLSESCLLVALIAMIVPSFGGFLSIGWMMRALAAAAAMAWLVAWLPGMLWMRIAAGIASYAVLVLVLRLLSPRDRELLRSLLKRGTSFSAEPVAE